MNTSTCFANHVSEEVVYAQCISLPMEEDKDRIILSLKERLEFLENKTKKTINNNPYGANVIDKVIDVLID